MAENLTLLLHACNTMGGVKVLQSPRDKPLYDNACIICIIGTDRDCPKSIRSV